MTCNYREVAQRHSIYIMTILHDGVVQPPVYVLFLSMPELFCSLITTTM